VYKHIPLAQRSEKKFGNHSSVCMMLGYVHNTTKVWRLRDFNAGRTGRALECSRVVFHEKENAHSNEQKLEAIVFPNPDPDELQEEIPEGDEMDEMDEAIDTSRQEFSKSRNPISPLNK